MAWAEDDRSSTYTISLGYIEGKFVNARNIPSVATVGSNIEVEVDVRNDGNVAGVLACKLFDVSTTPETELSYVYTASNVNPGVTVTLTPSFIMPNRDIQLQIATGHEE